MPLPVEGRGRIVTSIALALAFFCIAGFAAERPNILFILADDLGSHDVGWRGSEIKTPNLDKLAFGGARLEQFYVQPVCSPTRAALLTGRYPMRHGLQVGVVRPWAQYGLPLEERTLAQALREAGYATAIFGKWHLGHFAPEYLPTRRGFERQYGHYNGALDHFTHIRDGGFDWHRDDKVSRDEGYSTFLLADEAARYLREHDGRKPFFVYLPFTAVHAPLQVPEKYKEPYAHLRPNRQTYAGMIAAMDEGVGRVIAALDARGWRTNTLIVFASDNGGPNPGRLSSNGPLRAGKGTIYDGGVKVCAFANWPGQIKSNTVVNVPLHIVDWYPTLLKLAGAPLEQKLPLDGRDAWPALTMNASSPHDSILINASPRKGALRAGDWKLVVNGGASESGDGDDGTDQAPQENEPQKASAGTVELFNLAEDPGEANNVAATHQAKVRELRARYDALAKQQAPPKARPKAKGFVSPRVWGESD
ncbi:MAG TPA: arylsulfatase [Methylomirabilota bacterium]|nr:arylsulfatase [Methylomirabilota bacterium]